MSTAPTPATADALEAALHAAGWPDTALLRFAPRESLAELQAMVDNAGAMAGFGDELTLLRRYVALSHDNCVWLLAKVKDTDHAAVAAEIARRHGATLAVHYRLLTVEELI